jgi:hypothetical protein
MPHLAPTLVAQVDRGRLPGAVAFTVIAGAQAVWIAVLGYVAVRILT